MIVLALQFFNGDRDIAMQLAQLIADLEPTPRDDVEFLFSARFDTPHHPAMVEYVRKKFPRTFTHTCRRTETGWPLGCNALFAETYQFCVEKSRDKTMKSDAVLLMESDCVPTSRDWLNKVIEEWKNCHKSVLGSWQTIQSCGVDHINGNCIVHLDFWRRHKEFMNPPAEAWDSVFANIMMSEGAASKTIYSDYHYGTERNPFVGCERLFESKTIHFTDHPLVGQTFTPVWYHGSKGLIGIECVRKKLF